MSSESDPCTTAALDKGAGKSKQPITAMSVTSDGAQQLKPTEKVKELTETTTRSLDPLVPSMKSIVALVQPPQRVCHPFKIGDHVGNLDALITFRPRNRGCASMLISPRDTTSSTLYNSVMMYRLHGENGVSQGMVFPTTTHESILVSYTSMDEFMVLRYFASQQTVLLDSEVITLGALPLAGGRMRYGKLNFAIPPYSDIIGEPEQGNSAHVVFSVICSVSDQCVKVDTQLLCYTDNTVHPHTTVVTVTMPSLEPNEPATIINTPMESKPLKDFIIWSARCLESPESPGSVTNLESCDPPAAVLSR